MPKDNECLIEILLEFSNVFVRSFDYYEEKTVIDKSDKTLRKAIRRNPWVFMKIANKQLYIHGKYQFEKNINAITKFLDDCYDGNHSKKDFFFDREKIKEKWKNFISLGTLFPSGSLARDIGRLIVPYLDPKSLLSICLLDCEKNQDINKLEEELKRGSQDNDPEMVNFKRAAYKQLSIRKIPRLIACGSCYSIILMEDGAVFRLGGNSGDKMWKRAYPIPMKLGNKKAVQIACGGGHTLIVMEDGTVFSFGRNEHGELGRKTNRNNSSLPGAVILPGNKKAIGGACGRYSSFVLMNDGTVFSFGCNSNGQLGRKTNRKNSSLPEAVNLPKNKKAIQVACGEHFTVVLMKDGTVFSFGDNYVCQLGKRTNPISGVDRWGKRTSSYNHPIPGVVDLGNKKAMQVACGAVHTLILMEDGTVYGCGFGYDGELGKISYEIAIPQRIYLGNKKAIQIMCEFHSFVLMEDGSIFSFGGNIWGELGRKADEEKSSRPETVNLPKDKKAMQVACGGTHTLILLEDGTVFSFGCNEYGELGRKTNREKNPIPKAVKLPKDKKAIQVACGMSHTLIVMEDGTIYSFGRNDNGMLGRKTDSFRCNLPGAIKLTPMKKFKLENAIIRWMPEWTLL